MKNKNNKGRTFWDFYSDDLDEKAPCKTIYLGEAKIKIEASAKVAIMAAFDTDSNLNLHDFKDCPEAMSGRGDL